MTEFETRLIFSILIGATAFVAVFPPWRIVAFIRDRNRIRTWAQAVSYAVYGQENAYLLPRSDRVAIVKRNAIVSLRIFFVLGFLLIFFVEPLLKGR